MSTDLEDLKRRAIEAAAEAESAEAAFSAAAAKSRALCDEYAAAVSPLKAGDVIETNRVRRRYRIDSVRAGEWRFSGRYHEEPQARFAATCIRKDGTAGATDDDFWQAEEPGRYTIVERAAEAIS